MLTVDASDNGVSKYPIDLSVAVVGATGTSLVDRPSLETDSHRSFTETRHTVHQYSVES